MATAKEVMSVHDAGIYLRKASSLQEDKTVIFLFVPLFLLPRHDDVKILNLWMRKHNHACAEGTKCFVVTKNNATQHQSKFHTLVSSIRWQPHKSPSTQITA